MITIISLGCFFIVFHLKKNMGFPETKQQHKPLVTMFSDCSHILPWTFSRVEHDFNIAVIGKILYNV